MSKYWAGVKWDYKTSKTDIFHEAGLLKLNCDKALSLLDWNPTLNFEQTVELTTLWYKNFYSDNPIDIKKFTYKQIEDFENIRKEKNMWYLI